MCEKNILMKNNHLLSNKWTIWIHMPLDKDWSLSGYKNIITLDNVENSIAIISIMPDILIKYSMMFIMKENIQPLWEYKDNKNGGSFSYKVSNKLVVLTWTNLFYALIGNTISNDENFTKNITGITISPKKNFCIIKIWMKDCSMQNCALINHSNIGLSSQGCIFKKHG